MKRTHTIHLILQHTQGCEEHPFTGSAIRRVVGTFFDLEQAEVVADWNKRHDTRCYVLDYTIKTVEFAV